MLAVDRCCVFRWRVGWCGIHGLGGGRQSGQVTVSELIIACVRTGEHIPFDCVMVLRNAVARHLARAHTVVCLTDQPERCSGVAFVDISAMDLAGQWARFALFEPQWRAGAKVIHLSFDVVVVGDLTALADIPGEFAICRSEAPSRSRYDSSVMVLGALMGNFIWNGFERRRGLLMHTHGRSADKAIEELYPSAPFLKPQLPEGFFKHHLRLM